MLRAFLTVEPHELLFCPHILVSFGLISRGPQERLPFGGNVEVYEKAGVFHALCNSKGRWEKGGGLAAAEK